MIKLAGNSFNRDGYWNKPLEKILFIPIADDVSLFDQNGYDLTVLEQHFAISNDVRPLEHRKHKMAIKQPWFIQDYEIEGPVLNHSLLLERKAYAGPALDLLKHWAKELPLIYKVISMRPKWGLDFSMDYVDRQGNAFEILHWEWDSFDYDEIENVRSIIEPVLLSVDWNDAGNKILEKKSEWHHLDFFGQSDWKCNYFGIPKERFKMVTWK